MNQVNCHNLDVVFCYYLKLLTTSMTLRAAAAGEFM